MGRAGDMEKGEKVLINLQKNVRMKTWGEGLKR